MPTRVQYTRQNRGGRAIAAATLLGLLALLTTADEAAAQGRCAPVTPGIHVLWAAADVDGDRVPDLVGVSGAARGAGGALRVLSGGCALGQAPLLGASSSGETLSARDLDADHDLDLVHLDAFGVPVRIWLNDGAGRFERVPVRHSERAPPIRHTVSDEARASPGHWLVAGATPHLDRTRVADASPAASRARGWRQHARPLSHGGRPVAARGPPALSFLPHA